MKNELDKKILQNAIELADDAKYLFDGGRYKRAFFLLYTSFEELEKLVLSLDGKYDPIKNYPMLRHSEKSSIMNLLSTKIKAVLASFQKAVDFELSKIKETPPENINLSKEDFSKQLEVIRSLLVDIFPINVNDINAFNFRNASLYFDNFNINYLDIKLYEIITKNLFSINQQFIELCKSELSKV